MWKEEAEVYLTVLYHHLAGGTETINNLSAQYVLIKIWTRNLLNTIKKCYQPN